MSAKLLVQAELRGNTDECERILAGQSRNAHILRAWKKFREKSVLSSFFSYLLKVRIHQRMIRPHPARRPSLSSSFTEKISQFSKISCWLVQFRSLAEFRKISCWILSSSYMYYLNCNILLVLFIVVDTYFILMSQAAATVCNLSYLYRRFLEQKKKLLHLMKHNETITHLSEPFHEVSYSLLPSTGWSGEDTCRQPQRGA